MTGHPFPDRHPYFGKRQIKRGTSVSTILDNPDPGRQAFFVRLLTSVGGHIGGLRQNLFMMEELEQKQK